MDNVRVALWLALLAMLWLAYTAWVTDHPPPAPANVPSAVNPADSGTALSNGADRLPSLQGAPPAATAPAPPAEAAFTPPADVVHVRTDVLDVLINLRGGDLVRADLPNYPVTKHEPDKIVRLLDYSPEDRFLIQTGLRGVEGAQQLNQQALYRSASPSYELAPGQDELVVTLEWAGDGALMAKKTYTFRRGQYAVDLALTATTRPGANWQGAPYLQMRRLHKPPKRRYTGVDTYSVTGPVLYNGDHFKKLKVDDLLKNPVDQTEKGGWLGAIQHHFVTVAVPPRDDDVKYDASASEVRYDPTASPTEASHEWLISAVGKTVDVGAATPLDYHYTLFVGPKLQEQLKAIGAEVEYTVDYGPLKPLSQILFTVLSLIESWVGNWGWAIILMTLLIKLVFYKLTAMSARSMAKMRKLAPKMKALQERYKDDRQAQSQALMELYRKEKVNPAAGCLPMLIQMPFFFAFYWVLVESVEMRQAPFMLWIDDLSSRDPWFILPAILAGLMFLQTKMSPPPPDPMQARMMQIMPLVFGAVFFFFPAGLVLYWLTNTGTGILQQWRINTLVARESS
ncbi:MAG TPA: membrane protein insertase YidC [Gammaproteobacteria bacterium]|nr:membrane protein insertase YidC [Gammaproteobacteria bacterium]